MDKQLEKYKSKIFINNMLESFIRIGLLVILLVWTYDIIKPFIIPVLWGAIIAVALMPLTLKLEGAMKGKAGIVRNHFGIGRHYYFSGATCYCHGVCF